MSIQSNHPIKVVAQNRDHLEMLIQDTMKKQGPNCDLNFIDVSNITEMSDLFTDLPSLSEYAPIEINRSDFNGDISRWDVSNVKNMQGMFNGSQFDGDISKWDVSKVRCMRWMFLNSSFKGDLSNWNVSNVETMEEMFAGSALENLGKIPKWYKEKEEFKKRAQIV